MYGLKDITDVTKLVSIHFMGEFELDLVRIIMVK